MKTYRGSLSQISPSFTDSSFFFSSSESAAIFPSFFLLSMLSLVRKAKAARNERSKHLTSDVSVWRVHTTSEKLIITPRKSHVLFGIRPQDQSRFAETHYKLTMLVRIGTENKNVTHMETQLEIETINAVPTPRLDVGEKAFAAQLL